MQRSMLSFAVAMLAGCATMAPGGPAATAQMTPTAGNNVRGTVNFKQEGSDVMLVARLTGVPAGKHGFHIHEKGDCSAPDGMSAGGHFNPAGKPHGSPSDPDHHAGDMSMLEADAAGNAVLEMRVSGVTIGSGANDIVGKAVIVHKDADDFKTQPTGNSGARIACGVIARA